MSDARPSNEWVQLYPIAELVSRLRDIAKGAFPHSPVLQKNSVYGVAADEIERLRETYRREREAHAANLQEQQKCEAEIVRLTARETELLNLIHEAMPYMLNTTTGQDCPQADWVRAAGKAGGSLLAGYHAMNLRVPAQPDETGGGT
jgi:hypothetical protein